MIFLLIVFWIIALPIIIIVAAVIPSKRPYAREEARIEEIRREAIRRQNTPFQWPDDKTKMEFEKAAIKIAKPITRLKVSVKEQFVYGTVRTVSGLDTWEFVLDYNDYGKLTGNYWITQRGNYDSQIPSKYGDMLKNAVVEYLNKRDEVCSSNTVGCNNAPTNTQVVKYCRNCGTPTFPPGRYCKNCGTRLF